jgi:hypothetical protein
MFGGIRKLLVSAWHLVVIVVIDWCNFFLEIQILVGNFAKSFEKS